ncbi:MAG TPA: hypothetical protein VJ793_25830 [Anaerolineae bacterium]|nr:hypothetical protein [Anaerolineae bacterium]
MSFYVSIIGIDGCGKSTVTPALASLAAAELDVTAAAVGDGLSCKASQEDLCAPGFAPDGEMISVRIGRLFWWLSKSTAAHRRLYPLLKLLHLAAQARTVQQAVGRYQPGVVFSEGNLLLSAGGRAINYVDADAPASALATLTNPFLRLEILYDYVMEGKPLSPDLIRAIPGLKMMRWLRRIDVRLKLGLMELPDAIVYLDIAPEVALARLVAGGQKLDPHENILDLTQARVMYRHVVSFFRRRRGERYARVIDVTGLSVGQTLRHILDFVRTLPIDGGAIH